MCTESTLQQPSLDSNVSTYVTPKIPNYALKVLKLPQEVKKITLDAENEQFHHEMGNNTDEIKKNDIEYIVHIHMKIDVNSQPESVNWLGRSNVTNRQTIKIIRKSDQENVMANLRKLKGTEEEFGKIRFTNDYNERD